MSQVDAPAFQLSNLLLHLTVSFTLLNWLTYQGQLDADDGQWTRPAKDYASTRYSSLDQINADNAKTLKLAFPFSTGMTRGHEAAPLVVNNTMYIVTPFPNSLYALDLTPDWSGDADCVECS